jgi:peptidoglycan/xylan/chitin deacetylase (PgdA/CDA1 family)
MNLRSPTALLYHDLLPEGSERDPSGQGVTVAMFGRQLRWLTQHGWHVLDLDGYLTGRFGGRSGRRAVLLTFDDGYRSTLEFGVPILRELAFPGLVFVPVGEIGQTARWRHEAPTVPLMDAGELRALRGDGIEIGVHGMSHVLLPGLSDGELCRETQDARDALADILGALPRAFAYPGGSFDARVAAAVKRAGFVAAFSTTSDGGRFGIPRTEVGSADTLRTLRIKLAPGYYPLSRALARLPALRRRLRRALH